MALSLSQTTSRLTYILNTHIKAPTPFKPIARQRTDTSIDIAYHLPIGTSVKDIERQTDALYAAIGAPVELQDQAGVVVISILTQDFPSVIPYTPEMLETAKEKKQLLLGYTQRNQPVYHPMNTNPHLLIAGTSGYGKTDLLRFLLLQLMHTRSSESLEIYIIDLKGSSFKPFKDIPHVRQIARSLRDATALLTHLRDESGRRAEKVWNTGTRSDALGLPTIVVIVDEASRISPVSYRRSDAFSALAQEADSAAADLSCVGRELQMGLWYCTQRPDAKIMNPQVKNNMNAAVAFRVKTVSNSEVVIDRPGAEKLPEDKPGRAIYSTTKDVTIQVPFIGKDEKWREVLQPYVRKAITQERKEETNDLGNAFDPSRLLHRTGSGILSGTWQPLKKSLRDSEKPRKGTLN